MATKNPSGSFDIILSMEETGGRNNICLSFGSGLFRKLGWSSGDWLNFDANQDGAIALKKIPEPSGTPFHAKKIKRAGGFYKICFYSGRYTFPNKVGLAKDKASFNLETGALTLAIPDGYWQQQDVQPPAPKPTGGLQVEDIAAAFRKL